jgi:hypothetical protein
MIPFPTTRRIRRAAAIAAFLILAACAPGIGPVGTDQGLRAMQAAIPASDGPIEVAEAAGFLNIRLTPTFAQALLLGARNDLQTASAVVTRDAVFVLVWTSDRDLYRTLVRIPFSGITNVQRRTAGAFTIETTDPQHISLGAPAQTGLFHVQGLDPSTGLGSISRGEALYEAVVRRMRQLRPGWQPAGA